MRRRPDAMTQVAGYSGTPLAAKLGIKPGFEISVMGAPGDYDALVHPLPEGAVFTRNALYLS